MINKRSINVLLRNAGMFLLAVTFLTSCSSDNKQSKQETESVPVGIRTAQKASIPNEYQFSGTLKGTRQVQISTKMMGKVTHLNVEEGDRISEGQVMVRIKDQNVEAQKQQVQAQLNQAQSALENTETNYNRIKTLYEQGSATQKEFDDMKTKYQSAQSEVQALKSKLNEVQDMLDYTTLTAPFDGYVAEKRTSQGDMASPGRPLLILEDFGKMEVNTSVPESQINLFNLKDTVTVDIAAAGLKNLKGQIKQINPSGTPASRQFAVKVAISRPKGENERLKSGMYATISLMQGGEPTIAVPENALISRGQLTGLYTVSPDEEAVLRWVRTGRRYEDQIEILSGLAEGDRYIVSYEPGLIEEGKKVEIR